MSAVQNAAVSVAAPAQRVSALQCRRRRRVRLRPHRRAHTILRCYRHNYNQDTTVVINDVPVEARFTPANQGTLTFGNEGEEP